MHSTYKRLGDFIRLVDVRNTDLQVTNLVGLTINKQFIPSVANIVGTDMSRYKIISKNQFACSTMQVRRDKKMPIALWLDEEPAIISQAYPLFEIITGDVLPEFLMMWFSRSEFDRQACFHAVGGVRGSLEWEDFLEFEIPIPPIETQREMVAEYVAVERRIRLNNALCQKLEDAAQALYRHWFEDFEFPTPHSFGEGPGVRPYKTSGGRMVMNEEVGKEIPEGWRVGKLGEVVDVFDSRRIPLSSYERDTIIEKIYPYYGASCIMDYVDNYLFEGNHVLLGEDGTVITERGTPILQFAAGKFWVNNHAHVLKAKNNFIEESLYVVLNNTNIVDKVTGAVQLKINQSNLLSIDILIPTIDVLSNFNIIMKIFFEKKLKLTVQTQKLEELKTLLLGKMAVAA